MLINGRRLQAVDHNHYKFGSTTILVNDDQTSIVSFDVRTPVPNWTTAVTVVSVDEKEKPATLILTDNDERCVLHGRGVDEFFHISPGVTNEQFADAKRQLELDLELTNVVNEQLGGL